MAKYIDTPVVDYEKVSRAISRLLRAEIEKRWLQMKEIFPKSWLSQSWFSQVLGSQPSKNMNVYRKIAHAIWLSDRQFDDIVAQAKREVFGGVESTIDVALSHALGGKEEAVKEALQHLEYLRAKYK